MLLLGIDVGTSSIKVSVVDAVSKQCIASVSYPEQEVAVDAPQTGWAEQSPDLWWEHVQQAILKCNAKKLYDPKDIKAIGIAYQMHGLVVIDKDKNVLRPSIIWCDSRAVEIGDKAFDVIGHQKSLEHLLNSPGNFTASKLAWVKQNEPEVYNNIWKIGLPGDFIAMKFTGDITITSSALSEGIFWDFKSSSVSDDVINYYGFDKSVLPHRHELFSEHGKVTASVAQKLDLSEGIPVSYKAGDQPNNALALNVLHPGEVAATAGTSGVIYGVSDALTYDDESRINTFVHVNHAGDKPRYGVLLCINGAGSLNRWVKENFGGGASYSDINAKARLISKGSEGVKMLPFGNGAERMLNNKIIGTHIYNIDQNHHTTSHIFRAAQEGIAYAFRYGLDIMRHNGMNPSLIKAGKTNMFLSDVFIEAFVNTTGIPVELYNCDGSVGAAFGAGIGAGIFKDDKEAFDKMIPLQLIEPNDTETYDNAYQEWKALLTEQLNYNSNS